ncbi:DUF3592 domain-containing protein [uncultured Streptomyces sp.]|uniref:DUF3592 domain-containing protein n=1 Tax=uncultured Streptomyces sp. TaxID=174707 RepID=UPI00260443D7|nr:DUF3592 domain-containing protein [uncultured Streptomyces sp.]
MTIVGDARGTSAGRNWWVAVRGFLTSVLVGGALACGVVAVILESVPLFCVALGTLAVIVAVVAVVASLQRGVAPATTARTVLARIESRRATDGEFADVPVEFDLTVAPDDARAYRVKATARINLVDLPAYPEGRIVVARYRPEEPWDVEIDLRPSEEWAAKAATARIDPALVHTLVRNPESNAQWCLLVVLGLLAGAAAVVLYFWGELTEDDTVHGSPAATGAAVPGSSSTTTTTTSSVTASASSASTLRTGEMRRLADTLVTGMRTEFGTRITIEERVMSAVGQPTGTASEPGDPFPMSLRALPYELLPGLVDEARHGLGIDAPDSWRIDITPTDDGPAPVIRVTVSEGDRSAYLLADAVGRITSRHPR